jgi:ubiquinone/menaquinone biosynthesis C-methylase UbiE
MSYAFDLTSFFGCLHCEGDLQLIENGLQCTRCGAQFIIDEGIVCLMPKELRTDYVLTPHHQELNRRTMEIGWEAAIREHTRKYHGMQGVEWANEYICSEARADFRFLMPVDSNSVILDVGSGWGNITTAFARTARYVIALDTNLDNLRFVQLRAQQEGLHNVIVAQGDACTLPIRQASCDAALMVGVLEWVAWGRVDDSPQHLQKRALQRIHRALKPGGCLYLAMANRFSFKYFLGARELYTNLRFVSVLPNVVARKYSRLIRQQDYREITYSLWGLRKLLHSVGFDQVEFHFPIPDYQNFRFLVDFEDRGVIRFLLGQLRAYPRFSRWQHLAGRIMLSLPLRLARFFWPNFCVLAVRS